MTTLNPLDLAEQDAHKWLTRHGHKVQDFFKTYTTTVLLKLLVGATVALAAAALNFPAFAVVALAAVIVALVVYAIYATKIMKAQDRENRWAYIDGKRVKQDNLDARIAMDIVTLALLGVRHAPNGMRRASPELRAALAFHENRVRNAMQRADAAEAVKSGTATDAQRRAAVRVQRREGAPPKPPSPEPIKARLDALYAERTELEAEIQSLPTAESIAKAMEAEEVQGARRIRRERQDAARKADQAARDRVRAGRTPTARDPAHTIDLRITANGDRDVNMGRGEPTPEQIARGDTQADAA